MGIVDKSFPGQNCRLCESLTGAYVIEGGNVLAYPENVSRLFLTKHWSNSTGKWVAHYNHLWFWDYYSPTGEKAVGADTANLSLSWNPSGDASTWRINATIKNLWGNTGLYPIVSTGSITGTLGVPSIEERNFWLGISYDFD